MRYLTILTIVLLMIAMGCVSEKRSENEVEANNDTTSFNQELADQLEADDYGMRRYVMAILKAGPNTDQDEEEGAELQRGHMANINRLAEEGVLVLAGPFLDGGEMRGIFIFDVETVEEARELTESDPAVQAGRLVMELHPWYGSAALLQVNEVHSTISKESP